jgi:hypothetical protein
VNGENYTMQKFITSLFSKCWSELIKKLRLEGPKKIKKKQTFGYKTLEDSSIGNRGITLRRHELVQNTVHVALWTKKGGRRIMEKIAYDKLHSLYSSPNIVRVIKSRRLRWAGHVARMVEGRGVYRFWLEGPKVRDYREDLGVGGRTTLSWTLGR